MKNIIATLMYIAFGLGSLPDVMPVDGGMLTIAIFDHKPKIERRVTNNSVYLFSMEM